MNRTLKALLYLTASILVSWQASQQVRDWTASQIHQQNTDQLLNLISQLRNSLDEFRYLPFFISQNENVVHLLQQPDTTKENSERVSRFLEQTNLVAGSTSQFVLDRHGNSRAFSHWRDYQDFYHRSHEQTHYFQQAKNGEDTQIVSAVDAQGAAAFISAPIYSDQLFMGAAVIRVNLSVLKKELPGSLEWVIRSVDGQFLLASDLGEKSIQQMSESQKAINTFHWILSDNTQLEIWSDRGRDGKLISSVMLDDLQWQITVATPIKSALNNARLAATGSFSVFALLGILWMYLRERQLKIRSQQETREAIAENEKQQKRVINQAQVGLIVVDAKGQIQFANETAQQQFAMSQEQFLQKSFDDVCSVEIDKKYENTLAAKPNAYIFERCLANSPVIGLEGQGMRSDRSQFPIMFSFSLMQSSQALQSAKINVEKSFLVTIIDISRRKRLEVALQQANEQLEKKVFQRTQALEKTQADLVQAEKLAALGRMSTAIVHELNQPLTAMRNYTAICRHLSNQPEQLVENLALLDHLTDRMTRITQQLKTFAYRKPEHFVPVDLKEVIDSSLKYFSEQLQEWNVQLHSESDLESPTVLADRVRMEQIIINLIANALDAMKECQDKHLSISISSSNQASNEDDVDPEKNHNYLSMVRLTVQDSGSGIASDTIDQLFEPFFTTKIMGSGLGLGLSIVQSIVTDLGGRIIASNVDEHSQLGTEKSGALFSVYLPLANCCTD